jgi:transcriptional regulator with XRE-family HTH domain
MPKKRIYRKAPVEAHNRGRMKYIGGLLKEYRNEQSRQSLSASYRISRILLQRIENGENITVNSLFRLCDIYQVSPEEVFLGVE